MKKHYQFDAIVIIITDFNSIKLLNSLLFNHILIKYINVKKKKMVETLALSLIICPFQQFINRLQ